jgi:hypothetical protein
MVRIFTYRKTQYYDSSKGKKYKNIFSGTEECILKFKKQRNKVDKNYRIANGDITGGQEDEV